MVERISTCQPVCLMKSDIAHVLSDYEEIIQDCVVLHAGVVI